MLLTLFSTSVFAASPFNDVSETQLNAKAILQMNAKGIVNGIGANTFGVNSGVSKEQAIIILVRTLGAEGLVSNYRLPSDFINAQDVSNWAIGYLGYAIDKKIVMGINQVDFQAKRNILKFELAVYLARALDYSLDIGNSADLPTFTDEALNRDLAYSAKLAIGLLVKNKIIPAEKTSTGKLDYAAKESMTREEIAVIMHNVDKELNEFASRVFVGTVTYINTQNPLEFQINTADGLIKDYSITDITPVFAEDKLATGVMLYQALRVIEAKDGTLAYAETINSADPDLNQSKATGRITAIPNISPMAIKLQNLQGKETMFLVDKSAKYTNVGIETSLEKLKINQEVSFSLQGPFIMEIMNGLTTPGGVTSGPGISTPINGEVWKDFQIVAAEPLENNYIKVSCLDLGNEKRKATLVYNKAITSLPLSIGGNFRARGIQVGNVLYAKLIEKAE